MFRTSTLNGVQSRQRLRLRPKCRFERHDKGMPVLGLGWQTHRFARRRLPMQALQRLPSLVFMIRVLLAGIGLFPMISVLVGGSARGLIGSSAQAAGELPRDVLAAQIRIP